MRTNDTDTFRVLPGESPDALLLRWEKGEHRSPRIRLVIEPGEIASKAPQIVSALLTGGKREVGLATNNPATLPPDAIPILLSSGLSFLEWTIPRPSIEAFNNRLNSEHTFQRCLVSLEQLRRSSWGHSGRLGSPQHPALSVDIRLPLPTAPSQDPPFQELLHELFAPDTSAINRISLELWPKRDRGGAVHLPPFAPLATTLHTALQRFGRRWTKNQPSLAINGATGVPLCLFHPHPEVLDAFRTAALSPHAEIPSLPACRGCQSASWCMAVQEGPLQLPRFRDWHPSLTPFQTVPEALTDPAVAALEATPAGKTVARLWPTNSLRYEQRVAEDVLWGASPPDAVYLDSPPEPFPSGTSPKVLLAHIPGSNREQLEAAIVLPPDSLVRIYSALKAAGAAVEVRDLASQIVAKAPTDPMSLGDDGLASRCVELLQGTLSKVDLLAMSVDGTEGEQVAGKVAQALKDSPPIVLGGRGVSSGASVLERFSNIQFVVEGEGDFPIISLLHSLRKNSPPRGIAGLCHRANGLIEVAPSARHDFDALPTPDLRFADFGRYFDTKAPFRGEPVAPYMFVHGCPFQCAFCGDYSGGRIRARSVPLVISDLKSMSQRDGWRNFLFLNTQLNVTPRYIRHFVEAMEASNLDIRFADSAKPLGLDLPLLKRLRKVGCVSLTWGIDAASPRLARLMNKGFDLDAASQILKDTHDAGILNIVNLIQGLPHENEEDFQYTVQWLEKHRPYVDYVNLMSYQFMHTSLVYRFPERYNLRFRHDVRGFDEVDGHSWEEKRQQIKDSHARMSKICGDLGFGFVTGDGREPSPYEGGEG